MIYAICDIICVICDTLCAMCYVLFVAVVYLECGVSIGGVRFGVTIQAYTSTQMQIYKYTVGSGEG